VVDEHLGADHVEEVEPEVELCRWRRRLDALCPELLAECCKRRVESLGDVWIEVDKRNARLHRDAPQRSACGRRDSARQRSQQWLAVAHRACHRPGVVERRA